jgi:hypothetical protein
VPIPVVGFLLVCSLGCSNRSPTEPAPASLQEAGAGSEGVARSRRRPPARVVEPRGASKQLQGLWGGDHIGLTVVKDGAQIEFDCAAGSIDEPFLTDSSGRFALLGSWWFTPPVLPQDWQPDKRRARYSGLVEGNRMTLMVTRLEDNQWLGTFTLFFQRPPFLLRCL